MKFTRVEFEKVIFKQARRPEVEILEHWEAFVAGGNFAFGFLKELLDKQEQQINFLIKTLEKRGATHATKTEEDS